MTKYKCTICKEKNNEDETMLLAEWELGLSNIEDYYVCKGCYENKFDR